jgi:hypothetical protein
MAWMHITCQCGHTADLDEFCQTPLFGQLPRGTYQCPACRVSWKRQESDHRIIRHGSAATYVAGKVEIALVESRL